ncbi:MAG TPA: CAP domain-containing protein, partial [Ilumatobacteraceae bacterium]|nr:CAP domain-containing protein [Ilumatobacteraceae bacterium]
AGFATVYPCGSPRPNTSNINFAAGSTVANAVTSKVGAGGAVCLYNDAATHLIVDVNGFFLPTANFGALDPARLVDTRRSSPAVGAEDVALILINELRASRGLGPVASDATMTAFARSWSLTMSQSGFRHSGGPNAENIGWSRGGSSSPEAAALGLHAAFVASPPHLANMTNPAWTAVGIGVHYDGTTWHITVEFR